jgi:methionyl-tRNA synthetase
MREIMALTDAANQYVDSVKPWELAKQEGKEAELHAACSNALNPSACSPATSSRSCRRSPPRSKPSSTSRRCLDDGSDTRAAAGHAINAYEHLMTRVDPKQIDALVEANKESLAAARRLQNRRKRHAEHQQSGRGNRAGRWEPFCTSASTTS